MGPKPGKPFDRILIAIVCLSAFLNLFNLWNDATSNAYYTSAVTSMLQSWHNFFFASFDPGGFVTVDKPPVAFWIQTLFAYVFGVHGWSVALPQALAGVGSVLILYRMVKPTFGLTAARWSSLIMACTPIAVAVARTNNIDSLLVFTLLVAAWLLFRAADTGKPAWVFGSFALIGVAFNMKMLQAYMVLPAFFLYFLLAYPSPWKKKLALLLASTVILAGVSLSWPLAVDSMAKDSRPYIGSSQTNSVLELAFGYNGISRLTGNQGNGGPGTQDRQSDRNDGSSAQAGVTDGTRTAAGDQSTAGNSSTAENQAGYGNQSVNNGQSIDGGPPGMPPNDGGGPGGPGGQGGGMFGTGTAGPLRLFQTELSGQASWLLPFVLFSCIGMLAGLGRRQPLTAKQRETLFWLAWLVPGMVFFSIAGFFHHYYLIMLAPPIAALAGAGWVELWSQYGNHEGWKQWLLPSAVLVTTAFELYVLQPFVGEIGIGLSIGVGFSGAAIALLLFLAVKKDHLAAIASTAAVAVLLVLLAAPLYWAATPLLYGDNSSLPQAGPSQGGAGQRPPMDGQAPPMNDGQRNGRQSSMTDGQTNQPQSSTKDDQTSKQQGPMGGGKMGQTMDSQLYAYLTEHNTGEKYLFATMDSHTSAPYIIQTGKAVMTIGGFSGSDPILTVEKLKQLVANKEVKYFLISSGSNKGGPGGSGGNSALTEWIRANGTEVPQAQWQGNTSQENTGGPGMNNNALYEIKQS